MADRFSRFSTVVVTEPALWLCGTRLLVCKESWLVCCR